MWTNRVIDMCFQAIDAVSSMDSLACRVPFYSIPRGLALDILFGPEEPWDYKSRTAPAGPPPSIS